MKYKTYTQKEAELPELVDNKGFQPVRNMIIRTVLNMKPFDVNTEIEGSEPNDEYFDNTPQDMSPLFDESEPLAETETDESAAAIKYYIKWNDQYKKPASLSMAKTLSSMILRKQNSFCYLNHSVEMFWLFTILESFILPINLAKKRRNVYCKIHTGFAGIFANRTKLKEIKAICSVSYR